jgi:fatty acid desaturase
MSAKSLRQRYMRRLVGMRKYSTVTAWGIVGSYVLQILIAATLGYILVSHSVTFATILLAILLQIFIATRLRGLNNIIHECSHHTFSTNRLNNERVGKMCAAILMNSFEDYRDEHLTHHAHLGDYLHDRDFAGIQELGLHEPLTKKIVARHMIRPFLCQHLPYYLRVNLTNRDGSMFWWIKVALLFFVIAFSVVVPLAGVLFLVIPFVFLFTTLNYWADCLDHAGLVESGDDFDASRNICAPYLVRVIFFPRNDCFHLVHHLFPQVPARHLSRTHELLVEDSDYRSRRNAVPRRSLSESNVSEPGAATVS